MFSAAVAQKSFSQIVFLSRARCLYIFPRLRLEWNVQCCYFHFDLSNTNTHARCFQHAPAQRRARTHVPIMNDSNMEKKTTHIRSRFPTTVVQNRILAWVNWGYCSLHSTNAFSLNWLSLNLFIFSFLSRSLDFSLHNFNLSTYYLFTDSLNDFEIIGVFFCATVVRLQIRISEIKATE